MDNKKSTLLLTVIAVATLLVAVVGATFAYFTAQLGSGTQANVSVTTSTSDSLVLNSMNPISITATQQNFYEGAGDQSGETTGTISLTANADADASYCYTAKLTAQANSFDYTTDGHTPELVFTITKNGTAIFSDEDITVLGNTTSTNNTSGATYIEIPTAAAGTTLKHTITAIKGNTTTDTWVATVTLKNLDSDQQDNTGKSFTAVLNFDKTDC